MAFVFIDRFSGNYFRQHMITHLKDSIKQLEAFPCKKQICISAQHQVTLSTSILIKLSKKKSIYDVDLHCRSCQICYLILEPK
jgi:hypothetical protein